MLLQKVCAGPKTKFNQQKSSFDIAQKVLNPQITILPKDTNINIPTSANKLFIVLCFMNLFLNITANNYKIYMLLNINVRISKLCSQDEFTFKYNCNSRLRSSRGLLLRQRVFCFFFTPIGSRPYQNFGKKKIEKKNFLKNFFWFFFFTS